MSMFGMKMGFTYQVTRKGSPVPPPDLADFDHGFSLRQLDPLATECLEIRRDNGDTQVIGFNSLGYIDTDALLAFVGSGDGRVTRWIDQDNGIDILQGTVSQMPYLVESGSIVTAPSGVPAIKFPGGVTDGCGLVSTLTRTVANTATEGMFSCLWCWHSSLSTNTGEFFYSGGTNATFNQLGGGLFFPNSPGTFGVSARAPGGAGFHFGDWEGIERAYGSHVLTGLIEIYHPYPTDFVSNVGAADASTTRSIGLNNGMTESGKDSYITEWLYEGSAGTTAQFNDVLDNMNAYWSIFNL